MPNKYMLKEEGMADSVDCSPVVTPLSSFMMAGTASHERSWKYQVLTFRDCFAAIGVHVTNSGQWMKERAKSPITDSIPPPGGTKSLESIT